MVAWQCCVVVVVVAPVGYLLDFSLMQNSVVAVASVLVAGCGSRSKTICKAQPRLKPLRQKSTHSTIAPPERAKKRKPDDK